jgi:hypothetical protein
VFFLRAMAASFLAFAAARRSSRVMAGLLATSSSDELSSSESSSSSDVLAFGSFSEISFPSASRGRRLREKCLPPVDMLEDAYRSLGMYSQQTTASELLELSASASCSTWWSSWRHDCDVCATDVCKDNDRQVSKCANVCARWRHLIAVEIREFISSERKCFRLSQMEGSFTPPPESLLRSR